MDVVTMVCMLLQLPFRAELRAEEVVVRLRWACSGQMS